MTDAGLADSSAAAGPDAGCRAEGVAAFRRRDAAGAVAGFAGWADRCPEEASAHLALARALALAGRLGDARAACARGVAAAPDAPWARLLQARLAAREGDARARIAALKQAVLLLPAAVSLRVTLAGLMGRRLQHRDALGIALDALRLAPADPAALAAAARCHLALNEPAEAEAVLARLGAEDPPDELVRLRADAAARLAAVREVVEVRAPVPAGAAPTAGDEASPPRRPSPPAPFGAARPAARPGVDDIEGRVSPATLWAIERRRRRLGLVDHLSIVRALILRDIRLHHRGNAFGVLVELVRPAIVVVVHYWLFYFIKKQMPAEIPIPAFVLGGFATWFAFNGSLLGAETGGRWAGGAGMLPGVTILHLKAAKAGWALMLNLVFCLAAFLPMNLFGSGLPLPDVPLTCLVFGLAGTMGFGLGLVLERLQSRMTLAKTLEKLVSWGLFVTAGLYFSLALTPPEIAGWFWYNPLIHLLEYERHAFDPGYPVALLDLRYPAVVAAGTLLFGLLVHRGTRCAEPD